MRWFTSLQAHSYWKLDTPSHLASAVALSWMGPKPGKMGFELFGAWDV